MRAHTSRLWRGLVAAAFVLLLCLVSFLQPVPAWAKTSAQLSSDGVDYGWLFRRGDYFYSVKECGNKSSLNIADAHVVYVDGRYYWAGSGNNPLSPGYFKSNTSACEFFYPDGTLWLDALDGQMCFEAYVRSGKGFEFQTGGSFWDSGNAASKHTGFAYGRNNVSDVKRVIFSDALDICWEKGQGNPTYLNSWFEGMSKLEEVRGLEYVPTSHVNSMARMFAGCEQLEELDLTSLSTARCSNFSHMFDGCVSLTTLKFGEGWNWQSLKQSRIQQKRNEEGRLVENLRLYICQANGYPEWTILDDIEFYSYISGALGLPYEEMTWDKVAVFAKVLNDWYDPQLVKPLIEDLRLYACEKRGWQLEEVDDIKLRRFLVDESFPGANFGMDETTLADIAHEFHGDSFVDEAISRINEACGSDEVVGTADSSDSVQNPSGDSEQTIGEEASGPEETVDNDAKDDTQEDLSSGADESAVDGAVEEGVAAEPEGAAESTSSEQEEDSASSTGSDGSEESVEPSGEEGGEGDEEASQADDSQQPAQNTAVVNSGDGTGTLVVGEETPAIVAGGTLILRSSDGDEDIYNVDDDKYVKKSLLATFPVPMRRQEDGMVFAAGDVIPEGAGTYVVADRVHLKQATVTLSHDGKSVNASAGKLLTCEYTGKGIRPAVKLVASGHTLKAGIDYEVTSCEHNTQVGEATIKLKGIGDYYGVVTVPFKIEDSGAYAFLYQNGLLYLKHGNEKPSASVVSSSTKLLLNARWFDSHTAMPGTEVPWASQAAKVKKVVIDKSFFACAPVTCASWFDGCTALTSIKGLENIDTYDVKSMAYMFCDCTALTELSLSKLDTSHVKSFAGMVRGCKKLERLILGDLDLSCATSTSGFLTGCSSLKELVCGDEFVNAKATAARLAFDKEVFRTKLAGTTSYKRIAKGAAVPAGSATYRLRDLALQFAKVEMTKGTFTCTGKALKPSMVVKLGSITLKNGTDYSITYANNVYPGKAKGTITGKGVFSGGLVVPFTIKARVTHVGDRLVYKNSQATYTLKVTKVSKNGLVAEAELIDVKVLKGTTAQLALPSQCTIGGVTVSLTTISSKLKGTFRNVTTVIIGAKVTKIGARAFAKTPKVKKLIVKSARLTSVKNCLAGSKVTRVQTKVSLTKAKRLKYKVWFTQQSGRSGVTISFG